MKSSPHSFFMCFCFLSPVSKNEWRIHFIFQLQTDFVLLSLLTFSNQVNDSLTSVLQEIRYCISLLGARDQYEKREAPISVLPPPFYQYSATGQ